MSVKKDSRYRVPNSISFIEKATGRILRTACVSRSGSFGDYLRDYSDSRAVDGLIDRFKVDVAFNGKPSGESIVHVSVTKNVDVVDDAFKRM